MGNFSIVIPSGTVDIPTTSAPADLNNLPSAGVSYDGPPTCPYIPLICNLGFTLVISESSDSK